MNEKERAIILRFSISGYADDCLVTAKAETKKEAFAKAVEWQVVGTLTDITVSDDSKSYTIAEFSDVIGFVSER